MIGWWFNTQDAVAVSPYTVTAVLTSPLQSLWIFCVVGAMLCLIYIWYLVGDFIYRHFIRRGKDLRQYGEWAVVTGATAGIGRGIAMELANKHGMKV